MSMKQPDDLIVQAMTSEIRRRVEIIAAEETASAQERVAVRMREIIAETVLSVQQYYSVERYQSSIVITVGAPKVSA